MTEESILTLSDEEMVAWANAALERERELRREIVRLKAILWRHQRAIETVNRIATDMLDKVREHGPTGIPD